MQLCLVRWLGLMPYQEAWDLQNQIAGKVASGEVPPTLLLLEHPHTFTFGRKGQAVNLLWTEAELLRRGIQVFWVDRGGDVTYHGPGQLVGYPIIPLNASGLVVDNLSNPASLPRADYLGYLRKLEQVLIRSLIPFGVQGETVEGLTGVWVNGAKIAAIGVKVDSHGITRHGFALNIAPDMTYWEGIIGCGLAGCPVTSLAVLQSKPPPMEQVIQTVISAFGEVFDFACQIIS